MTTEITSFSHNNITEMCCVYAVMIFFFFPKATLILYNDENASKMQKLRLKTGKMLFVL